MRRYEDEGYGRREDPRPRRTDPREDRHSSSRVEARDRRTAEDPRETIRSSRTQQADPMDVIDPRGDPRLMNSSRIVTERGANAAVRLEPRPEGRHAGIVSSRARDEPAYDYDHKSSRMVDPRTTEAYTSREQVSRYATRDDRMDTDMDMAPTSRRSAQREVIDSRGDFVEEDPRPNRYNDYFVPGTGM
jgi:hypothetical protein